jgi:general secretion pathway protein G
LKEITSGATQPRRSPAAAAFTLTEMLVVLVIVGLLTAVVGPRLFNRLDSAKQRTALVQIANLSAAVDLFRLDVGRPPSAEEGLAALVSAPELADWFGPYLAKQAVPKDPWGGEFVYEVTESGAYRIVSYGADKAPGGEGKNKDISTDAVETKPQAQAQDRVTPSVRSE